MSTRKRRVCVVDEKTHKTMLALKKKHGVSMQIQARKAIELYAAEVRDAEKQRLIHIDAAGE